LRADAARFGDKAAFTRRILSPTVVTDRLPETPFTCLNCGAPVPGQYCASCGQSREVHVLSMHEVLGDVTHSLLHLDSRAWSTLRTLVLRPGELTREFIAGRHQRYLPPFRLYLVISVMFFALSALLPDARMVKISRDGNEIIAPIQVTPSRSGRGAASPEDEAATARDAPEALPHGGEPAEAAVDRKSDEAICDIDVDLPVAGRRLDPLLQEACRKVREDGGRHFGQVFLATAPKLMFVFLPLVAGVAMLFYWRPRRLYAEHLVALLHSHAFLFLALALTQVTNAIMRLDLPLVGLLGIVNLALMLYVPWYVFRSMRVVYGEGRVATTLKFAAISLLYFVLLGITIVIGVFYSMLSL
jgi:hypothetical protein